MVLTSEQASEIKVQLLAQIENLPNENKDQIKEHVNNLNDEDLEGFLKQNNIALSEDGKIMQAAGGGAEGGSGVDGGGVGSNEGGGGGGVPGGGECIFCSIVGDKIPYYKISENAKSIAILELNPMSKGHCLVLPRDHVKIDGLSKTALRLAQKIAKIIKSRINPIPIDVKIETSSFMDHAMINIIPIYKDTKLEKYKASEDELKEVQELLETKAKVPKVASVPRVSQKSSSKLDNYPMRIP